MNDMVTIGLTGDVMLGRTLDSIIGQRGYAYPWGNVLALLRKTDLNIINLETTFTTSEQRVKKTYNFKAAPDKIQSLLHANISIVNLANNHILDYAREGLVETINTLDSAGIRHVGAGVNHEQASNAAVIGKNNIRIGVLGLTDNEPEWKADGNAGTNYVDLDQKEEKKEIFYTIENLRAQTDFIIASIHWGPNMAEQPSAAFIRFAHDLIDHGVNVIHGHSAHIVQGVECYNNNLILYDTGDFVDDYAVNAAVRNDLSAFFILTIDRDGIRRLKIIPVRISNYQFVIAQAEDRAWVMDRIKLLSSAFKTHINEENEICFNETYGVTEASRNKPETNSYV